MGKPGVHAVRWFAGAATSDSIRHDQIIFGGVQGLAGTKELAAERRREKVLARSRGSVKQQDSVVDLTLRVLVRGADRGVMRLELRKRFTALEFEILDSEIVFFLVGIVRRSRLRMEQCAHRQPRKHNYPISNFASHKQSGSLNDFSRYAIQKLYASFSQISSDSRQSMDDSGHAVVIQCVRLVRWLVVIVITE